MNRIYSLALSTLLVATTCALGADKSKSPKSPKLPEYPHQPNVNTALKHLGKAQELAKGSGKEVADAIVYLKKAQIAMEGASKKKGSFKATAVRLSGQAAKDLENGLTDKAAHNIEEALEAVHKAGQTAEK